MVGRVAALCALWCLATACETSGFTDGAYGYFCTCYEIDDGEGPYDYNLRADSDADAVKKSEDQCHTQTLDYCGCTCRRQQTHPADAAVDAGSDANVYAGVACGNPPVTCAIPAEVCCDTDLDPDLCVAASAPCSGKPLACDGPEDCPSTQECCLYYDRSECLDTGICGTTGAITEVMCHVDADCDTAAGEICCGTSPGPVADIYGVCSTGACPQ